MDFFSCVIVGVVAVMLAAGILGGAVNILQARKADEPRPRNGFYYFLLSISAAFSVPLFLSLTKSALLGQMLVGSAGEFFKKDIIESWFIFFAVCLVVAIYARVFLESVSKKLIERVEQAEETAEEAKKRGEQAEETAEEAKKKASEAKSEVAEVTESVETTAERVESSAVASDDTAAAEIERKKAAAPVPKVDISRYDERTRKVIAALQASQYSLRSPTGIARDAGLTREETRNILLRLVQDGVVMDVVGPKTGRLLYMLRRDALTGS